MTDTFLYVEYTGIGPTTVITKWRPGVSAERVQELLANHSRSHEGDTKYDYAPTDSSMATYWRGVMRVQTEKMINEPIDFEDGTWSIATTELIEEHFDAEGRIETTVVNVVDETPVDKREPKS